VAVTALDDRGLIGLARSVVEADARAVHAVLEALDEEFVRVARLLGSLEGKVLVTGCGTSGAIAARAAHMLSVCGCPAFYLPPDDGLNGGLGVLQPSDVLIALSKGGGSAALNEFCIRAKSLCRAVVAITAAPESALAGIADHLVALKIAKDADLGDVVATGSSLATGAVLDALCEAVRVLRGYDWKRLLFTHPLGAVGRDAPQTIERLTSTEEGSDRRA
jgi:D-arabinose 5-phosphate isomerase GutQ